MADADTPQSAGLAVALPGFRLRPSQPTGDPCWFEGKAEGGGGSLLVRRIDGIPFSVAVRDLAATVELFDACPAGMAAPLAIAVSRDGRIVAGFAAAKSGLDVAVDSAAAAAVATDAAVDVWVIYCDDGLEALDGAVTDPKMAAERLAQVAAAIDRLPTGHGVIDQPALRIGSTGPLVLAFGLNSLEAARRERLDAPGPWLSIAPERCLPPGLATAVGDQYSLATLWVTARTGRPPHVGDTAEALVRSKLADPPGLGGLDAAERDVVARALTTAAENRFESCAAFTAALCRAVTAVAAPAPSDVPSVPESEPHGGPPAMSQPAADTRPGSIDATVELPAKEPQSIAGKPGEAPSEQLVIPAEPPPPPSIADTVAPVRIEPASTGLTATAPYKPGDLILPGYRLERRLGKGGFGEVWKAAAPGGMSVAIKVIGSLGRREGVREFRALRTVKDVHHAHIVPIFGVWLKTADGRILEEEEANVAGDRILQDQTRSEPGTLPSRPGLKLDTMELIMAMGLGDRTLYDALQNRDSDARPGIEPGQLIEWMRQAALAIDHFNRGGVREGATTDAVQHCDIKPQNMLLVGNVVQVCDFGLARKQGQVRATANNLLSIAYAAPEMMIRPHDPSPTTDQYSLAVSYYELRTGRLPYGDQPESASEEISAVELIRAKTDGKVEVGLVPPPERRVLLRALALDPADRFGSCEELVDMLELAVEMDGTPRPLPAAFPWLKAFGLAGGGVVAAALLGWILLRPDPNPVPTSSEYVERARKALDGAVKDDGINQALVEQAAELAAEVGRGGESSDAGKAIEDAAHAVLRALPLIQAIRDDGKKIAGLEKAEAALSELPESVPLPLRVVLENELRSRKQEVQTGLAGQISTGLEGSVRDDGSLDAGPLEAAAGAAELLAQLDSDSGMRFGRAVEAMREISAVITAGQPEPAGLDSALASLHRGSPDLPPSARSRLERGLARKVVERAVARLNDNDLRSPGVSIEGKKRALEDSVKDLELAIRLDPGSWQAHDRLGLCESLRGRHPQAIDAYGKALRLITEQGGADGGTVDEVLRRRAYALAESNRYAAAAADYVAAANLDTKVCSLVWELKNRAEQGKLHADVAVILDLLDRLLTEHPDCCPAEVDPFDVAAQRAWLLACGFGDDSKGRAVPFARQLVERAETALRTAGEGRKADLTESEELTVLRANHLNSLDTLACAFALSGDFDAALRTIDEALAGNPDDEDFLRHRARFETNQPWDEP